MIQFWKKLPYWGKIAVAIIALIIILLIAREIKYFWNKPRAVPVNWQNVPVVGTSPTTGQTVYWNPDPLAQELSDKLEGVNLNVYPETVQKILDLQTDDQVKLLYNHYNKKYAKDEPTLTQLIAKEWPDWSGVYKAAVSRLKSLGLY